MFRRVICLLTVFILLCTAAAAVPALPSGNGEFSSALARYLLSLSSGYTASETASQLAREGFATLVQAHYDKPDSDPGHTCAFTLARADGAPPLYLLVIRGTAAGEWYSNFDFAPSHNGETPFAENFLYCAQDVLLAVRPYLEAEPDAVWLVTGHSRGAACANLFGLLLNAVRSPSLNYIYTSATPATLRSDMPAEDSNIFNLINPLDIVPKMPLAAWGYRRAGTDILLPADTPRAEKLAEEVGTLAELSPRLEDYYTQRHLLTGPGTGEDGLTVFEIMTLFAGALADMTVTGGGQPAAENRLPDTISPDSDLAPLADRLATLTEKDGLSRLLQQHMPDMYAALLTQAAGKEHTEGGPDDGVY